MVKIAYYVPGSHLQVTKQALFDAGAGQFEHYDQACWQVLGQGQYRPLEGADPFEGKVGHLEVAEEYKVEMICKSEHVEAAVAALKSVHPYEEVAFEVYEVLNKKFE